MHIYYLKKEEDSIVVADLRGIPEDKNRKEESVTIFSSKPLDSQELSYIKEKVYKGINKKIRLSLYKKTKWSLTCLFLFLFIVLVLFLKYLIKTNLSLINLLVTSFAISFLLIALSYKAIMKFNHVKEESAKFEKSLENAKVENDENLLPLENYFKYLEKNDIKTIVDKVTTYSIPVAPVTVQKEFLDAFESYLFDVKPNVIKSYRILRGEDAKFNPKKEVSLLTSETTLGILDIYLLSFYIGIKKKIKMEKEGNKTT